MNILCVEDNVEWFDRVVRSRVEDSGENVIYHAETKRQAENILNTQTIDYAILDLAIPLDDPNEGAELEHGITLVVEVREKYPGMPVLILSGQSTVEAAEEIEDDESVAYFWDGNKKNLVKIRKKSNLDNAIDIVIEASKGLNELENFELNPEAGCSLDDIDKRILRLFGVCSSASGAVVSTLSGGLSGSKVLRVDLINDNGDCFQFALSKIDAATVIDREVKNLNFVNRLPVAAFPSYIDQYYAGCGKKKGVFYQLAKEHTNNFFSALRQSDDKAKDLVDRLKENLNIWHDDKKNKNMQIADIRRLIFSDEKFEAVAGLLSDLPIADFETNRLNINFSTQHGDLHGANILVSDDNQPLLIDYGDVGSYPSSLDPITLELSPYFHPESMQHFAGNSELALNWFKDDIYFKSIKNPISASALRLWAGDNAFLRREIFAVTYSYCISQLGYEKTDKEFAVNLIRTVINSYE